MLPFSAQVFLSHKNESKSRPDSVGAVRASKAALQRRGSVTSSGRVSNHLWCSRYKDSIHLLTCLMFPLRHRLLTVSGQQGLCGPLLLICHWCKCALQLCVNPSRRLLKGFRVQESRGNKPANSRTSTRKMLTCSVV